MEILTVHRFEQEKVWIGGKNASGAALTPGKVVIWQATTTDADQGVVVDLPVGDINATLGIAAKVAGVVDKTSAATGDLVRLQVFGPANVRASASLNLNALVVTATNNATNRGHVFEASTSTLTSPHYLGAVVGWTLENGPNATNSTVHLSLL